MEKQFFALDNTNEKKRATVYALNASSVYRLLDLWLLLPTTIFNLFFHYQHFFWQELKFKWVSLMIQNSSRSQIIRKQFIPRIIRRNFSESQKLCKVSRVVAGTSNIFSIKSRASQILVNKDFWFCTERRLIQFPCILSCNIC